MPIGLTLSSAPTVEPVDVADAKLHCRIDVGDGDTLILSYLKAARRMVERFTNRQLITATWKLTMDNFPGRYLETDGSRAWAGGTFDPTGSSHWAPLAEIRLPWAPLASVTTIKYIDTAGTQQTLSSTKYQVDITTEPGRIRPVFGEIWPIVKPLTLAAVEVTYRAGYGDTAAAVPDEFKAAIRLLTGHYYENREAVVAGSMNELPMGVQALLGINDVAEYV
jgi:hypothetical protein